MRARRYRTAVIFPNSFGIALAAYMARASERVGTAMYCRGMLLTKKPAPQGPEEHLADAFFRLAEAAGGGPLERKDDDCLLRAPDSARARAEALLAERGLDVSRERFLVIAPGAAHGPAKQWGEANFADVARLAVERGLRPVVVGTGADRGAAREIARLASTGAGAQLLDLAGRTDLVDLAGVFALASGFVGNDSGAAHLASALGVPTVAIFLSGDPARTAPRGPRVKVIASPVDCRPCMRRECPRGDYRCRAAVGAGEVAEALRETAP